MVFATRLELPLRLRIAIRGAHDTQRKGDAASNASRTALQGLIASDGPSITMIRNMFAHGSDTVLDAPMFLDPFRHVTAMIAELFDPASPPHVP